VLVCPLKNKSFEKAITEISPIVMNIIPQATQSAREDVEYFRQSGEKDIFLENTAAVARIATDKRSRYSNVEKIFPDPRSNVPI
jgi:hypothetical protein